jgi:hypothetical protein
LPVLPPPTGSFADKVIYFQCYPPTKPYHDGSDEKAREFWQTLTASIPAFLHDIETSPFPEEFRDGRFFVKRFHHPEIIELISDASPVAPLGGLLLKWASQRGGQVEGPAAELFEGLKVWNEGSLRDYSSSARHFGHQLGRLQDLPGYGEHIRRGVRYVGKARWRQRIWTITAT